MVVVRGRRSPSSPDRTTPPYRSGPSSSLGRFLWRREKIARVGTGLPYQRATESNGPGAVSLCDPVRGIEDAFPAAPGVLEIEDSFIETLKIGKANANQSDPDSAIDEVL